jgi:FKBP-type peptidyl-prolyl cis-trans isomerase
MKKGLLTLIFALTGSIWLYGQCEGCKQVLGESIDFCYVEAAIPNRCAQFVQDGTFFYYQDNNRKKGTQMHLPLPKGSEAATTAYLLGLDPDKKLKLTAADLLLIAHGIEQWRQLEAIRKWQLPMVNSGLNLLQSGLAYKPLLIGNGKIPEKGKRLTLHFTGYLESGKIFESSLDKKQSFQFTLGKGEVIKGWDEGFAIMTVGSRYLLRIPPALAYGAAGAGAAIPPNATLYFDVQLISAE